MTLFLACGAMTVIRILSALSPASLFADSPQPSTKSQTPRHTPHSGFGLSHLGRLGMMLAFFGSATAESRNLRVVSETGTAYPEWQTHHYEAETRHIDGSSNWFSIAHIADGNSTAARFNVNGHNGDNHWNIDIQLWAGMNAISSCWNAVHPDHIPQGFRFARNTEGRIFLEVQGTTGSGNHVVRSTGVGIGFNPLDFLWESDRLPLMTYDFSTIGSLKGGCLSDQRSDGAGHVTMVDGVPVVTVKGDKLGIGTTDPAAPLDIAGSSTEVDYLRVKADKGTMSAGDGQSLYMMIGGSGSISSGAIFGHRSHDDLGVDTVRNFIRFFDTGVSIQDNSSTHLMTVLNSGNVGVGTPAPESMLHIEYPSMIDKDSIIGLLRLTGQSNHSTVPGYITSGFDGTFAYTYLSTNSRPNDATYTTPGNPSYGNLFFSQKAMTSTLSRFVFSSAPATAGTPVVTDLMTILQTGEVGIGTATPDALLSVNGVASFGAGTAALPSIAAFGDLNTGLWFPATDTVAVSTGGNEGMRITSGGVLNIGGSSTAAARLSQKLEVHASSDHGGAAFTAWSSTPNAASVIDINKSKSNLIGTHTAVVSGDRLGYLIFRGSDGTGFIEGAIVRVEIDGTVGTNSMPTSIFFDTTPAGSSSSQERMRITSSGNVGIGTTSPLAILDARGDVFFGKGTGGIGGDGAEVFFGISGTALSLAMASIKGYTTFASGGFAQGKLIFKTRGIDNVLTQRMVISEYGLVGIGTTTPGYLLSVHKAGGGFAGVFGASEGTNNPTLLINCDESANLVTLSEGGSVNGALALSTGGSERMRITDLGKIGIGTPTPDALLSVNGVASFGAGTAALPSIAAFGDLDTGLWFPAVDTVAVSTGGGEG